MALSWALFALALGGWLAVTAVIWAVLYSAVKQRVGFAPWRGGDRRRDDPDESGDSPA